MVIVPILFGIGILGIVMILVLAEKDFNEPDGECEHCKTENELKA